jgi:hypothetical protein
MKYLKLFESKEYIAPNGKPSNLGKYWSMVRSESFISWFGNWLNIDKTSEYNVDIKGNPKVLYLDYNWEPKIFYHGTNRIFDVFSAEMHRSIRNNHFQGDGFFFTDDEIDAWRYAEAAINQQLLKDEFFKSLKQYYPQPIYDLAEAVYNIPYTKAWDQIQNKYGFDNFNEIMRNWEKETGLDINVLCDYVANVEGAEVEVDERDNLMSYFSGSSRSTLSEYYYENAEKYHFKNALPKFNVIKAFLKMDNILKTDDREEARVANENGYDSVVYSGADVIGDKEYIVYNINQIKVIN